ncbi:hypothetical protein HK099_000762 [Clydaea vesicula]|uniref:FAD-binding domain-containing protein n=1 Tax=Clydaea vesicula TaxID=447962 RepID=A0AAD5TWY8_9FUNG|nr:hypothetical protein HK099_000762 [Clydaea vesicula]
MSNTSIKEIFQNFVQANTVELTTQSFNLLVTALNFPKDYPAFRDAVLPHVNFRMKTLFTNLDNKFNCYAELRKHSEKSENKNVLVSGGGPCGLRAAVDAKLSGLDVTLVELRDDFTRHNIIKTWKATIDDLVGFGLTTFVPGIQLHGHLHLGTREIQTCLLKSALIFGVKIFFNRGVCGIIDPSVTMNTENNSSKSWKVWTLPAAEAKIYLKRPTAAPEVSLTTGASDTSNLTKYSKCDFIEYNSVDDTIILKDLDKVNALPNTVEIIEFNTLLIAEGESSVLIRRLGFDRCITKFNEAIGLVVNLDFTQEAMKPSAPERKIPEIVLTRAAAQWRDTPLGKIADIGIEFENIEYMRGSTHFIAASTKLKNLHTFQIVKDIKPKVKESLNINNLDLEKLRKLGLQIALELGLPKNITLSEKNGVQIFDFSAKGQCADTLKFFKSMNENLNEALILPIGDSFQNPFWPQGLGINRGFHSSLDGVWSAYQYATDISKDIVENERKFSYQMCNWGSNSLDASLKNWTCDPISRYSVISISRAIYLREKIDGKPSTIPQRIIEFVGVENF